MPFLDKPNDVFVSYAHDDNLDGWVNHLALALELEVPRHLPLDADGSRAEVTLWKDDLLVQAGPLDDRLEVVVQESSTILVVTSTWYLRSTWCKDEGCMFFDRNLSLRDYRFFVAQKEHTDRSNWPPFLFPAGDITRGPFLSTVFYHQTAPQKYVSVPIMSDGYQDPRSAPNVRALGEAMAEVLLRLKP